MFFPENQKLSPYCHAIRETGCEISRLCASGVYSGLVDVTKYALFNTP